MDNNSKADHFQLQELSNGISGMSLQPKREEQFGNKRRSLLENNKLLRVSDIDDNYLSMVGPGGKLRKFTQRSGSASVQRRRFSNRNQVQSNPYSGKNLETGKDSKQSRSSSGSFRPYSSHSKQSRKTRRKNITIKSIFVMENTIASRQPCTVPSFVDVQVPSEKQSNTISGFLKEAGSQKLSKGKLKTKVRAKSVKKRKNPVDMKRCDSDLPQTFSTIKTKLSQDHKEWNVVAQNSLFDLSQRPRNFESLTKSRNTTLQNSENKNEEKSFEKNISPTANLGLQVKPKSLIENILKNKSFFMKKSISAKPQMKDSSTSTPIKNNNDYNFYGEDDKMKTTTILHAAEEQIDQKATAMLKDFSNICSSVEMENTLNAQTLNLQNIENKANSSAQSGSLAKIDLRPVQFGVKFNKYCSTNYTKSGSEIESQRSTFLQDRPQTSTGRYQQSTAPIAKSQKDIKIKKTLNLNKSDDEPSYLFINSAKQYYRKKQIEIQKDQEEEDNKNSLKILNKKQNQEYLNFSVRNGFTTTKSPLENYCSSQSKLSSMNSPMTIGNPKLNADLKMMQY